MPWAFDDEAVEITRAFARLKNRLMPYLLGAASRRRVEHGTPVLRPMFLEFPDDLACRYLDRQYMLGDSLLVAPVMSASGEVSFYLPDGVWTSVLDRRAGDGRTLGDGNPRLRLAAAVRAPGRDHPVGRGS